jgi:hypothetical protein
MRINITVCLFVRKNLCIDGALDCNPDQNQSFFVFEEIVCELSLNTSFFLFIYSYSSIFLLQLSFVRGPPLPLLTEEEADLSFDLYTHESKQFVTAETEKLQYKAVNFGETAAQNISK